MVSIWNPSNHNLQPLNFQIAKKKKESLSSYCHCSHPVLLGSESECSNASSSYCQCSHPVLLGSDSEYSNASSSYCQCSHPVLLGSDSECSDASTSYCQCSHPENAEKEDLLHRKMQIFRSKKHSKKIVKVCKKVQTMDKWHKLIKKCNKDMAAKKKFNLTRKEIFSIFFCIFQEVKTRDSILTSSDIEKEEGEGSTTLVILPPKMRFIYDQAYFNRKVTLLKETNALFKDTPLYLQFLGQHSRFNSLLQRIQKCRKLRCAADRLSRKKNLNKELTKYLYQIDSCKGSNLYDPHTLPRSWQAFVICEICILRSILNCSEEYVCDEIMKEVCPYL